jgi:hypothetical protein
MDTFFPYSNTSNSSSSSNPSSSSNTLSVYPSNLGGARDSTETITQDSYNEDKHTYPPKPRRKPILFSQLKDTPFARGFTEKLERPKNKPKSKITTTQTSKETSTLLGEKDNISTHEPNPSVEIDKGSVMFSSKFLDEMNPD